MSRNGSLGKVLEVLVLIVVTLVATPSIWAGGKYKTLYGFTGGTDGNESWGGLALDQAGNLYGTTLYGGDACYCGTVFELTNTDGGWTETTLHVFTGGADGGNPFAGVTVDQSGNLYGTTATGGVFGGGTVFKLIPNADGTWSKSVLYSFCSLTNCTDGGTPFAGVIFDQAGGLYGVTQTGGAHTYGTVFKLAPNADGSWTESVLSNFCSLSKCRDGFASQTNLVFDLAGNLFGVTNLGGGTDCEGGSGCGVVFELAPNADGSWTKKVLHGFTGKDGSLPHAALDLDGTGKAPAGRRKPAAISVSVCKECKSAAAWFSS